MSPAGRQTSSHCCGPHPQTIRGLTSPHSHLLPVRCRSLPATLKFPRRTKQKREEKGFHHRSREPTYKNFALTLPASLTGLEGFWRRPCTLLVAGRAGEGREPTRSPTIRGSPGSPHNGSPP